uniref:Uncharacterized protein n=1 Tax=Sphaerodactylus townsendi TaxID=933632 RepID=A0ACB8FRG5_9SAUR
MSNWPRGCNHIAHVRSITGHSPVVAHHVCLTVVLGVDLDVQYKNHQPLSVMCGEKSAQQMKYGGLRSCPGTINLKTNNTGFSKLSERFLFSLFHGLYLRAEHIVPCWNMEEELYFREENSILADVERQYL